MQHQFNRYLLKVGKSLIWNVIFLHFCPEIRGCGADLAPHSDISGDPEAISSVHISKGDRAPELGPETYVSNFQIRSASSTRGPSVVCVNPWSPRHFTPCVITYSIRTTSYDKAARRMQACVRIRYAAGFKLTHPFSLISEAGYGRKKHEPLHLMSLHLLQDTSNRAIHLL